MLYQRTVLLSFQRESCRDLTVSQMLNFQKVNKLLKIMVFLPEKR